MIAWLLALTLAFGTYRLVIYPMYFSPLAKVPPAHFLSPLTSLWINWKRFNNQGVPTVYKAFQEKGPVIRLGPNELSVNIIDGGIRTVYGGGFAKTQWYEFFINHGSVRFF